MWAIAIHGGAGDFTRDNMEGHPGHLYQEHLEKVLKIGCDILKRGGSAKECAVEVVRYLEDCHIFNAGKGSVCTENNDFELDAALMTGEGAIGSVIGVKRVKNPILLCKTISEDSSKPFIMYAYDGAEKVAEAYGMEMVDNSYFSTPERLEEWDKIKKGRNPTILAALPPPKGATGTVGCAALDMNGKLCAATSTGGRTGKPAGRVGDTPIIGASTYAHAQTCAISTSGVGEKFIRHCVTHDIHALMMYKNVSLAEAVEEVFTQRLGPGDGGIAAVDTKGEVILKKTTPGMLRAGANSKGFYEVEIA